MSVKVSSWVWHDDKTAGINGNEMILLLALADVADDNGRCRFLMDEDDLTYEGLARKVRVDRRTIERLIPKLRARGLVVHTKGTRSAPNEFAIAVPWAKSSTDKVSGITTDKVSGNGVDSPTAATVFPDTVSGHTSLNRIDVVKGSKKANTTKGSRLAEDWKPGPGEVAYAREHAPSVDVEREAMNFVDYWVPIPGQRGVKLDWTRTWQTWVRRAHDRNVERGWTATVAPRDTLAAGDAARDAWLAERGVTYEEYLERRGEPGWLASLGGQRKAS